MFAKVLVFAFLGVSLVLAQPLSESAAEKGSLGELDQLIEKIQAYYGGVEVDLNKFEHEFNSMTEVLGKEKYAQLKEKYDEYKAKGEHALEGQIIGFSAKFEKLQNAAIEAADVSYEKFEEVRAQVIAAVDEQQAAVDANINGFKRKAKYMAVEAVSQYFLDKSFEGIVQDLKQLLGDYVEVSEQDLAQYKQDFDQTKDNAVFIMHFQELMGAVSDQIVAELKPKLVESLSAIVQAVKNKLSPAKANQHQE